MTWQNVCEEGAESVVLHDIPFGCNVRRKAGAKERLRRQGSDGEQYDEQSLIFLTEYK
jgi:hypothetical protein